MKKAIIVDLEGTLTDCEHRMHFLKAKNYVYWNEGLKGDDPKLNVIKFVEHLARSGYAIIISTAKPEKYRDDVSEWLKKFIHLTPYIHMRCNQDKRPSPQVKAEHLGAIEEEFEVCLAIDDREDIIKMYQSCGKKTLLIDVDYKLKLDSILEDLAGYMSAPEEVAPEVEPSPIMEKIRSIKSDPKKVDEILKDGAKFFHERAKEYGTAYLRHGPIMSTFFPDGVELKTPDDFYQWHIFELMIIKMNRIASAMMRGESHPDSLHDIMIYAAMAKEGLKCE